MPRDKAILKSSSPSFRKNELVEMLLKLVGQTL